MRFLRFILVALWLIPMPSLAQEMMSLEPVTLISAQSTTTFMAEIADTDAKRDRGLMFRQIMPEDKAMLFDFGSPRRVSMWMKNTLVSLDMLFVREDGTIAAIAENTVPGSLDAITVQEPVLGVVEVAAGTVKRLGLQKEDLVISRIFKSPIQ